MSSTTIDKMIAAMQHGWSRSTTGMCLWTVQQAAIQAGVPGVTHAYPDANEAGNHSHIRYNESPPRGAIVWWKSARHGHVGIALGGSKFIGVDLVGGHPAYGRIGVSDLTAPRIQWGQTYRGWSADLCGHPIPGLGEHHGKHHETHGRSQPQPREVHLSDHDINRIAAAVWAREVTDPNVSDGDERHTTSVLNLLRRIRRG